MSTLIHEKTKTQVDRFVKNPKSGLILTGDRGAGKTYLANLIASKVLNKDIHDNPYVYQIHCKESGIDDVRALQKKLSLQVPGDSSMRRVVIFNDFDSFGHEAQNALLKTLEEPPLDTLLILTVNDTRAVLATIYSRMPQLYVRPITKNDALTYGDNSKKAESAYYLSGGAAGLFVALLNGSTEHPLAKAVTRAKELLALEKYQRLAAIDLLLKDKEMEYKTVLDGMIRLLNASYSAARSTGKESTTLKQHQARMNTMLKAIQDIESGVHQKLVVTRLFLAL